VKELIYNESQFQNIDSNTCGLFVLYFAIQRMHNLDLNFEEILEEIFDKDLLKNEQTVKTFCEQIMSE
jgi:hypothetical protein